MSDNEARARELLSMIRCDFMADAAFAHVVGALDAAEDRGRAAGLREARDVVQTNVEASHGGMRVVEPRGEGNLAGLGYAAAIDARLAALSADTPANRGEE